MEPTSVVLTLLAIAALVFLYLFTFKREVLQRKPKDLQGQAAAKKPLAAARRMAAMNQYEVIAPAVLEKNGAQTDLDFILVGTFGLLCVKCVGLGGEIYGSAGDAMWLQVCDEKRKSFENPLRRAERDTRLVRDALFSAKLKNVPVEAVVVFTNRAAQLALPRSTGHYTVKEFRALLDKSKYTQDKRVDISKTAGAVRAWLKTAGGDWQETTAFSVDYTAGRKALGGRHLPCLRRKNFTIYTLFTVASYRCPNWPL